MLQRKRPRFFAIVLLVTLACGLAFLAYRDLLFSTGGPTARQLLALLNTCNPISNGLYRTDSDRSPTIPICKLNGAIFWKADMDIDCDGIVTDVCNRNTDPWFLPDTAVHTSTGQPLDSGALPYVVLPGESAIFRYSDHNIRLGAVVAVIYHGQVQYGVFGDVGPSGIIGEVSYAMAKSLGIDPNPFSGGVDSGVTYIVFQNTEALPIEDHSQAVILGQKAASQLIIGKVDKQTP